MDTDMYTWEGYRNTRYNGLLIEVNVFQVHISKPYVGPYMFVNVFIHHLTG